MKHPLRLVQDDEMTLMVRQHMSPQAFLGGLQAMWRAGVLLVSPGALGMNLRIGCQPRPVERRDLEHLVRGCSMATWLQDASGNDWIVQT